VIAGVACVGALVVFVLVERRARDPVLALELIKRRPIAVGSLAGALLGASMMATILYVPLYVQAVLGRTPTQAGGTIAPMLVGWPIASAVSGRLLPRVGFRAPVWAGSAFVAVSLVAFAMLLSPTVDVLPLQALMFSYGIGMGFANTTLIVAVQSSVGWQQRGVATATAMFSRTIGGAIGVGALGAVLARRLGADLPADTVTALLDPARRASVVVDPHVTELVAHGLAPLFWIAAAVSVVNLFVVAFWPREIAPVENEVRIPM
jgi:MFS family permease